MSNDKEEKVKGKQELTSEEREKLKKYYSINIEILKLQKEYKQLLYDIKELGIKSILIDLKLATDESIKKGGEDTFKQA